MKSPYFRRIFCLVLTTIGIQAAAQATLPVAQPPSAATVDAPERPRIALVLSGGGARGLSHVGVLRVLEEARVPVDIVVGTSMGAIVGGLYASGLDARQLEQAVLALDWVGMFERNEPRQQLSQRQKEEDFELAPLTELGFRDGEFRIPTGALSSRSLELALRRNTHHARWIDRFDELPTPFRAVATDLETGDPVVLGQGDLATALRASMSVPGVFAPVERDGRVLGDGGLVNNLPVDIARRLGADTVIAVNIGTPLAGRETLNSLVGITAQMVNILTEQNVRRNMALLAPTDLLLLPDLGRHTSADFSRAADLIRIGYDYGRSIMQALDRFALQPAQYEQWLSQRRHRMAAARAPDVAVTQVVFEGVDPQRALALARRVQSQSGRALDLPQVERDLRALAATGDFEAVDYRLHRQADNASETLTIDLRENRWGPNYLRIGLDLRTDFIGRSAFNLRLSHNRRWLSRSGAEWRNRLQLGRTNAVSTELYQPWGEDGSRFLAAYVGASVRPVELFAETGQVLAQFSRTGFDMGLDFGWPLGLLNNLGEARLGLRLSHRKTSPELVDGTLGPAVPGLLRQRWREQGVRLAIVSDQLDHANFPSDGYRVQADLFGGRRIDGVAGTSRLSRFEFNATAARRWGPHTVNLGGRLARTNQLPVGAIDEFSLGGFQQLSGYHPGQVVGNVLAFGRLTYYHRLPWSSVVARALFLGGSLEAGNAWRHHRDLRLDDLRVGRSLFIGADTALGPLYLSLVSAARGYSGLYLFLGRP